MLKIFTILVAIGLSSSAPSPIGLFSVVQFPNDACTTTSGLTGTCVTSTECTSKSGSASGGCAAGFGVCCLITSATCTSSGTSISQNNTYLQNPSYPSTFTTPTSATDCAYTINKINDNICQLRLDFQTLELGQTIGTGACTDTFQPTVSVDSSSTNSYPSICGKSNGHHMYIHIGRTASATASLKVSLASGSSSAKWNILTRQIECDTVWSAPDGCSMWLTGTSGEWSMYGYTSGTTDTEYLMNQNYRVCMRQEEGFCSIRHSTQSSTSFVMSELVNAVAPAGNAGSTACYLDFIGIPGGSADGNSPTFDRFCGTYLAAGTGTSTPQAIISKSTPFEVAVKTDGTTTASATPIGAGLKYQLLPC